MMCSQQGLSYITHPGPDSVEFGYKVWKCARPVTLAPQKFAQHN